MPFSRLYQPKPNDIFYHYCSVETFKAICENRTMRFGDINMMNDYGESQYGYTVFEAAATAILRDDKYKSMCSGIGKEFFDKVDEIISPMQLRLHPVVACFSKEPDVLSQWRAYADNGRGIAIGFAGATLKATPVTVLEVKYDKKQQVEEMTAAPLATYKQNIDIGNNFGANFQEACQLIAAWRFGYKNSSFAEEKEVRCLHALDVRLDEGHPRLVDAGGGSDGNIKGEKVNFRVRDGAIAAYVDLHIPKLQDVPLIKEIWLGPRNVNGPGNIIYLLGECGIAGTAILRSTATCR